MKTLLTFVLFLGMFLVVTGVYQQKFENMEKLIRTEYRFIPRSLLEDAMMTPDLVALYGSHFDVMDPWSNRTSMEPGGKPWYYRHTLDTGTHIANESKLQAMDGQV
jgi:hypothetical protein